MTTITYTKALPTPIDEIAPIWDWQHTSSEIGSTPFESFLNAYSPIYRAAVCDTVNHLLSDKKFDKSQWNTQLQRKYRINKRHANGVIAAAIGQVESAKQCRIRQVKQLKSKLKSIQSWIKKAERKLKIAQKFYRKKNKKGELTWAKSKSGCKFPLSCSIRHRDTNWQHLRFQIHHKKRKAYHTLKKIEHLKVAPLRVKVPHRQCFVVGSKGETLGNQVCQWDGEMIKFRVPACLENRFGKYVSTRLGGYKRKINRLRTDEGAKTWHFYYKYGHWNAAVQFTPAPVERVSRHSAYGCIGIDINPGSIGWAYVDHHGNLKARGKIKLQMGLAKGKQEAQIVEAVLQIAVLADRFACPVVCEDLDFCEKKTQMKEMGRKYSRMLSGWAYSLFTEKLKGILNNRGIYLKSVNPAYTSLIGMVKYARQYGRGSDEAAAFVVARRGMRLSERLPRSLNAYLDVKSRKHVWSAWNQLNKKLKTCTEINRRHDYYSVSNWGLLVKEWAHQDRAKAVLEKTQTKRGLRTLS